MVIDIVHARATTLGVRQVIVLTTDREVDDSLAAHCADRGYACLRGHATDLVRRTLQAIDAHSPDAIVRVNGDCPLFEPTLANAALAQLKTENGLNMVSNIIERSFPYGVAVECITTDAYVRYAEMAGACEREHVTQHLYRLADRLSLYSMRDKAADNSSLRLTLDTEDDAKTLAAVCTGHDVVGAPYWEMLDLPKPHLTFRKIDW